jgi:hypothetical protein
VAEKNSAFLLLVPQRLDHKTGKRASYLVLGPPTHHICPAMSGNNTTFTLALLVLLAAIGCHSLPASADDTAATGEGSAWSAFREPVADLWSAGLGYNLRGREQQVGLYDDEDEDGARVYSARQRGGENGGGVCDPDATTVCSGHGWCTDEVCVCKKGWTGYQCQHERKSVRTSTTVDLVFMLSSD